MSATPPQTLTELKEAITEVHLSLSKRLRQIAQYLLDNPDKIAFGTVAVIAEDSGVHPSTLVRFANAFGYSGFTEMQRLFQQQLIQESPSYSERIKSASETLETEGDSPWALMNQFAVANTCAIEQLPKEVPQQALESAVQLLAASDAVHIVGVRRAFTVASYFAYLLRHVGRRAFLIDGVGGMYSEQSSAIGNNDALIAISFHPYGEETQEVVQAAVNQGVPTIVITDSPLCPLAATASVCFTVKEAELHGFRSLTSSLVLAQSLSIALASSLELNKSRSD